MISNARARNCAGRFVPGLTKAAARVCHLPFSAYTVIGESARKACSKLVEDAMTECPTDDQSGSKKIKP